MHEQCTTHQGHSTHQHVNEPAGEMREEGVGGGGEGGRREAGSPGIISKLSSVQQSILIGIYQRKLYFLFCQDVFCSVVSTCPTRCFFKCQPNKLMMLLILSDCSPCFMCPRVLSGINVAEYRRQCSYADVSFHTHSHRTKSSSQNKNKKTTSTEEEVSLWPF